MTKELCFNLLTFINENEFEEEKETRIIVSDTKIRTKCKNSECLFLIYQEAIFPKEKIYILESVDHSGFCKVCLDISAKKKSFSDINYSRNNISFK